jgi:hypothetical protein
VLAALLAAGAEPQDLAVKLRGERLSAGHDLVYLWVRRPVVEWALRPAATSEPGVEMLAGVQVPVFAYGLSFALAHAQALARATVGAPDADAVIASYRATVVPEAAERYRLACEIDDARARRWRGEQLDVGSRDGCYPLFSFTTAIAAAPYDDLVLRRTIGRIGLLDRTAFFDDDTELHARIERIFGELMTSPPPSPGPSREALLRLLG